MIRAAGKPWLDTSPTGAHATAGAGTSPILVSGAINGQPALRFDGVDDFFALPAGFEDFTSGVTLYVVARPTVLTTGYKMVALGNGAGLENVYIGHNGDSGDYQYVTTSSGGDFGWFPTSGGAVAGVAALVEVSQPGGTPDSLVTAEVTNNGTVIGSGSVYVPPVATRSVNYLGASYWVEGSFTGDMAEVLIYDRELTAQERADLTTYFGQKYGLGL